MRFLVGLTLALIVVVPAISDDVFRIEVGKDYSRYSQGDLKRRVWQLERAVDQLQMRVFQLEGKPAATPAPATWVCTISSMGKNFSAAGETKAVAMAKVMEACSKGGDSFFCKDPKCEQ